jgi:hypothetical protein
MYHTHPKQYPFPPKFRVISSLKQKRDSKLRSIIPSLKEADVCSEYANLVSIRSEVGSALGDLSIFGLQLGFSGCSEIKLADRVVFGCKFAIMTGCHFSVLALSALASFHRFEFLSFSSLSALEIVDLLASFVFALGNFVIWCGDYRCQ